VFLVALVAAVADLVALVGDRCERLRVFMRYHVDNLVTFETVVLNGVHVAWRVVYAYPFIVDIVRQHFAAIVLRLFPCKPRNITARLANLAFTRFARQAKHKPFVRT
jgi:hypothetical protein